jgi:HAE1 family hydrophobic/amphiphilic exporter-1
MFLTRFSLNNPIAVTLFFALVGLIGTVAFGRMGRSILPPIAIPAVSISAPYPGAAPEEIERLVVAPIEDQLRALPDVDRVSSFAQDGIAAIDVRFRFGSKIETDRLNVQQAVDAARATMPGDLVPPMVREQDPSQAPVLQASVTSAFLSTRSLSDLVENQIAPALRDAAGVGTVTAAGELTRQFTVAPRLGALAAVGGTPLDVLRAIASAGDVFPGGRLRTPLRESTIGVRASADTAESLRMLPVWVTNDSVRVGDVATVRDAYDDPNVIVTADGQPAVILSVSRASGASSLMTIASAERAFTTLAQRFPLVRFTLLRSDAPYTIAATDGVFQTIAEGVVLTVVVMLFFLRSWRNALIAAISIPVSLAAALAVMWMMGFSIDVLSLMGLSLTIGILVDDSIVIIEAIANNAKQGLAGDDAALAGRRELGPAAFAITLVDVAVFAPIAFMSGLVGQFMREFGLAIVCATAFSLLVSFTLTPLLAARWSLRPRASRRIGQLPWMLQTATARNAADGLRSTLAAMRNIEGRLADLYAQRWLPAAWRRRRLVAVATAAACAATFWLVLSGRIATEFSPPTSAGRADVSLTFPAGTPLDVTAAGASRLAQRLLDDPRLRHVVVTSGRAFNGVTDVVAGDMAQIDATLEDQTSSGDSITDEIKGMQPLVPDAQIAGAGRSMAGTAPVSYNVVGGPNAVDVAAARIAAALRANPFATDVRSSNAGIGQKLDIQIDPAKAMLLGVSADDAAQTARIATGGEIAAKVRTLSGLTNVIVRSEAANRGDLGEMLRLPVRAGDARVIALTDLVSVTNANEPTIIERENGRRVVTVSANTAGAAPIGRVTGPLASMLRDPKFLPLDSQVEPRGDIEQFLDTVSRIGATLGFSVLIVYVILAILYRSYVLPATIMLSVPLAAIGAVGALFVTSSPLNLYSMLGIVMLIGLVAKNGILLVDYAERAIRGGADPYAAMIASGHRRFRPILMTTVAMIAGMLPLALGQTIGAQYRQALGVVVIGGLASSLLLTLFLVPIAYVAYHARARSKAARSQAAKFAAASYVEVKNSRTARSGSESARTAS